MISFLIDAVLHALNDANTPAAYWVLKLLDSKVDLQEATREIVSPHKIHTFQETVGTPFLALLKENISNQFATQNIVTVLAIFDPRNITSTTLPNFPLMERSQWRFFSTTMEKIKFALTLNDEGTVKTAVTSPEMHTWITYHTSLAKKPKDSIA